MDLGYTEPDARDDLSGVDVQRKAGLMCVSISMYMCVYTNACSVRYTYVCVCECVCVSVCTSVSRRDACDKGVWMCTVRLFYHDTTSLYHDTTHAYIHMCHMA